MKYLSLFFLFFLISCQTKEEKSELDYVKIEMFPYLGGPPSTITVDLKNNLITFANLQQIGTYNENCEEEMNKIGREVEFVYITLNEEEIKIINEALNDDFLDSVMKSNKELLDNPNLYDGILYDGVVFELDIVKENKVHSTDDYLILEEDSETKIAAILKIINKHVKLKINKSYIEHILFFVDHKEVRQSYIHGLH